MQSNDDDVLLQKALRGDKLAWSDLLAIYRDRLRRVVMLRIDVRVQGRIDPSDVLQEAYLQAHQRLPQYAQNPDMPFFLWLRFITCQKLLELHRRHLQSDKRDAGREISLFQGSYPETSSAALAAQLMGRFTNPSEAAIRAEIKVRLQEALNSMDVLDREVLALRHFEQLSNRETAQVLGVKQSTASKRYMRALTRLKDLLEDMPGGAKEVWP